MEEKYLHKLLEIICKKLKKGSIVTKNVLINVLNK